jgi:hypothetical protein
VKIEAGMRLQPADPLEAALVLGAHVLHHAHLFGTSTRDHAHGAGSSHAKRQRSHGRLSYPLRTISGNPWSAQALGVAY